MKHAHYYSPRELGFDGKVVPGSGSADGRVVAWRAEHNFQTVTLSWHISAGVGNHQLRVTWIDWDGATPRGANVSLFTGSFTALVNQYWIKNNQARTISGGPSNLIQPVLLGAPYVRFNFLNSDPADMTVTLELTLSDGVKHA